MIADTQLEIVTSIFELYFFQSRFLEVAKEEDDELFAIIGVGFFFIARVWSPTRSLPRER